MKMKLSIFVLSFILSSCTSYMNTIYRDMENQERLNADLDLPTSDDDTWGQYRKKPRRTSTEYNRGTNKNITTNNQKVLEPSVKRQYKDEKTALKRVTASDLTDNGTDGSLWAGSDPNAFLFTSNKTKTSGDIVQINVLGKLKEEISLELKKAFPDNPYEVKASKEGETKEGASAAPDRKVASSDGGGSSNVQDKISGVVVEEINREHLLIKGRKNVLFKNRKRMVEVQALVSRKDIGEDDTISSDSILESTISVVR